MSVDRQALVVIRESNSQTGIEVGFEGTSDDVPAAVVVQVNLVIGVDGGVKRVVKGIIVGAALVINEIDSEADSDCEVRLKISDFLPHLEIAGGCTEMVS